MQKTVERPEYFALGECVEGCSSFWRIAIVDGVQLVRLTRPY